MQMVVDSLIKDGNIYKKMQEITPSMLGIRNKIKIYLATDVKSNVSAIFAVSQKSKLLMKDVYKFEEIFSKLSLYCDSYFKYKILFIDAPICSKAKAAFEEKNWKIH